jgi:hypothetical protein
MIVGATRQPNRKSEQVIVIQKFFRRWKASITVTNLRYARDQYQQFQHSQAVQAADREHRAYEWDMHR